MTINLDLLDEESATEAIKTVAEIADANDIEWALVGGLAMAIYGSDRTTKDIDIIANLPIENESEKIKTDLLVGADGVARAIRLVN